MGKRIPACAMCGHAWHGLQCTAIGNKRTGISYGICDCKGPFADETPVENEGPKTESTKGKW